MRISPLLNLRIFMQKIFCGALVVGVVGVVVCAAPRLQPRSRQVLPGGAAGPGQAAGLPRGGQQGGGSSTPSSLSHVPQQGFAQMIRFWRQILVWHWPKSCRTCVRAHNNGTSPPSPLPPPPSPQVTTFSLEPECGALLARRVAMYDTALKVGWWWCCATGWAPRCG